MAKIKLQGSAGLGGTVVVTVGTSSTTKHIQSFPACTLTIYEAGTLTLSSLWSDSAGTIVKANPFTASASDATWFAYVTAGSYDVRFSGTGITTPFTIGDIAAAPYVDSDASTTVKGITKLSVAPVSATDPIAVGQNVMPINVRDAAYGATGNGATDDRTAIQAALDAVPSEGGMVYFPHGTYLVSGSIRPKSNTTIFGDGYGSQIKCPSAGGLLVAVTNMGIVNVNDVDNVRITNLRISGTKSAPTDALDTPSYPSSARTPKLIYLEDTNKVTVDHCYLDTTRYEGIWGGGAQADLTRIIVSENHISNVGYPAGGTDLAPSGLPAVQFNAEEATISNNVINNVGGGIGVSLTRGTISGNTIRDVTTNGISTGDGTNDGVVSIAGNTIEFSDSAVGPRFGILLDGSATSEYATNVVGNTVRLVGTAGVGTSVCYYVGTKRKVSLVGNSAEIQVRGVGFRLLGSTAGTEVSLNSNTVRVVSESGVSMGFTGFPNGAGQTLTVRSSGNRVFGMTRAQNSFAFDYNTLAGGTLNATLSGDVAEQGYVRLGSTQYDGSELNIDGVPLFENFDTTAITAYLRAPRIGMLNFQSLRDVTIAAGVFTISGHAASFYKRRSLIRVDTESAAATDDLDTINGGQAGDVLILGSADNGRDVTIKNGTGNIFCGSDFTLATTRDRVVLLNDGTNWIQLSRSTN